MMPLNLNQDVPPPPPTAPTPETEPTPVLRAPRGGIAPSQMVVIFCLIVGVFIGYRIIRGPSKAMAGWHTDYSAGVKAANETKKPMLMLFTADWCPPCQQLKADVWTDEDAAKRLQEQFTLVKIDLTEQGGESGEVAATYNVRSIPTIIVFGTDGKQVAKRSGGGDKESIMGWLEQAGARGR